MVEGLDLEKYQYFKKEVGYCDDLSKYLSIGINDLFDLVLDCHKEGIQEWNCPFCGKTHTTEIATIDPKEKSKIIEDIFENRKNVMWKIANELYGLFGAMYSNFDHEYWCDEKRDIFNEIINLAKEEAYCTNFHGVSPHEIAICMNKTKELIEKIIVLELKDIDN